MSTAAPRAVAIINSVAGPRASQVRSRRAADLVRAACARGALSCDVVFTEYPGHACEIASDCAVRGVSPVIAWGGDGTVNEVASALAFRDVALGIVPAGSGNGLARELGISRDPERALATAIRGRDRVIDVGELGGRLFVNLAGIGLDAAVAEGFRQLAGRGLRGYVQVTLATVFRYEPQVYTVTAAGETWTRRALIVAFANGTQYGNGARIAPRAKFDDGRLELVVVPPLRAWQVPGGVRRLFNGTVDQHPGVTTLSVRNVTITANRPICFHVDGEVVQGGVTLTATTHPGALRVRTAR